MLEVLDFLILFQLAQQKSSSFQELLPKYNLMREDVFITTKFFLAETNNAEHTRKMVDESLKNLRTE